MKLLAEMFGVIPGYSAQLENAGVCTILDLARARDLENLSRTSSVPIDLLGQWQERAVLELANLSHRRRWVGILVIMTTGLFLAIAAWSYAALRTKADTTTSASSALLSWKASSSPDVVGYSIYRSQVSGGPYQRIAIGVKGNSYVDHDVRAGQTYYYVVKAFDKRGFASIFSSEISFAIPAHP